MPRKAAGIEPVTVKKLPPGRYGDGSGLYLLVRPATAKQKVRFVGEGVPALGATTFILCGSD